MSFIKRHKVLFFITSFIVLCIACVIVFPRAVLRIFFSEKIWAHRVNTIENLDYAAPKFKGVELDVVFDADNDVFDIHHPPEPSSGLTLSSYFSQHHKYSHLNYWIDFKNLCKENAIPSSLRVDSIISVNNIPKSFVIIESTKTEFLHFFKDKGFLTSYYLPTGLRKKDTTDIRKDLTHIKQKLKEAPTDYISIEYRDYTIINQHFPKHKKIIWSTLYGQMGKIKAGQLLFEIVTDDKVDVLLLPKR